MQGISSDIYSRITQAADELYDRDSERLPTVDEVRRAAKTDMNATSAVMREWRRQRIKPAVPAGVMVPAVVQEAFHSALVNAWAEAQKMANETLEAAQKAWEEERAEADQLRAEMSDAFERQGGELEAIQQQLAAEQKARQESTDREGEALNRADALKASNQELEKRLAVAERREQDRTEELQHLRTSHDRLQAELIGLAKLGQGSAKPATVKKAPRKKAPAK